MIRHPVYKAWSNMKNRCLNPKSYHYKNYGARGITICDRWLDSSNFINDMLPTWEKGLSIDRINNNGNYEPSNCHWVNQTLQLLNRRINLKSKSGYRGVRWYQSKNKWRAQVTSNFKCYHIGYYHNVVEAAKAFDNFVVENNLPNKKNFN